MQNEVVIDGFKISIWTSELVEPACTAVNMTTAIEKLSGYDLTEEEKTEQPALMAGYCRLIDEAKLVGYGDTEFEAIADLFRHAKKVNQE